MAENATTIEQLDILQPADTDLIKELDDAIRLIKSVMKVTFPGANGQGFDRPVLISETEFDDLQGLTLNVENELLALERGITPLYSIIPYTGLFTAIPAGYSLCNGLSGTPNMTDFFIRGTITEGEGNSVGGFSANINPLHTHDVSHTHTTDLDTTTIPAHTHTIATVRQYDFAGGGNPVAAVGGQVTSGTTDSVAGHSHNADLDQLIINTSTEGTNPGNDNLPAYYKIAYIMRTS